MKFVKKTLDDGGFEVTITLAGDDLKKIEKIMTTLEKDELWHIDQCILYSQQIKGLMKMTDALERANAIATIGRVPPHQSLFSRKEC